MRKTNDRPEKDEKKSIPRKSRAKIKTAKDFIEVTAGTILKYPTGIQNIIIKELYFAIRQNRLNKIEEAKEVVDTLVKLNEELPVGE